MSTSTLILLRHGKSARNSEDRFAGWVDVPLTERGKAEAVRAGRLMAESGVLPEVAHLGAGPAPGRHRPALAHGNSIRALTHHLEELTPDAVARLKVPKGLPVVYRLDERLRPLEPDGRRLGPGA